ncbi:hypothetical protein DX884_07285, partial [Vibrio fluvialis]|nr:hypothetical protein [Vibrio fluvialis]
FEQLIFINVIHKICLLNYRLIFYIGKTTGKYYRGIYNHLLLKNFLAFRGTEHAHSGTKHA